MVWNTNQTKSCLTLQEFRRISFSGYVLNGEQDNYFYMSLSRLHPQRIHVAGRLSESTPAPPQHAAPRSAGAHTEEAMLESEAEAQAAEADSEVRSHTHSRVRIPVFSFMINKVSVR